MWQDEAISEDVVGPSVDSCAWAGELGIPLAICRAGYHGLVLYQLAVTVLIW